MLFFAVPNCRVRFRDALVGGLLTTLFFEAAKRFFTTIVAQREHAAVYGTFAAVPLFLTWLYLVWVLILSGAIVVRTLGIERDDVVSDGAPMLVQCIRLLAFLRRRISKVERCHAHRSQRCGQIVRRRARGGVGGAWASSSW